MKILGVFFLFVPCIAFAQTTDEIGQEWNNSTSVEFPATSTDEEGNVIYNYYGDDSQYFGGDQSEEPADAPQAEGDEGELTIPLNDPDANAAAQAAKEAFLKNLAAGDGLTGYGLSDEDYDFFFGSGNDDTWGVSINGSLVRDTLKKQGVQKINLEGWNPHKDDQNILNWLPLNKEDLSLVAAAAVFRDANIDQVHLTLKDFSIQYAFQGYLFYFIPLRFNASIAVDPLRDGSAVQVIYPWYQFFLWKPITKTSLDANLESVVSSALKIQTDSAFEKQARVFGSVADALRSIPQP